jgi:dihydrolipoamide dehydrogenase
LVFIPKIGAGVIGCEYATIFSNYGVERTKVFLIDKADRILPFEDDDISKLCAKKMEKKGVVIHRGAKLHSMKVLPDSKIVIFLFNNSN